jgi:hypothetical protein
MALGIRSASLEAKGKKLRASSPEHFRDGPPTYRILIYAPMVEIA